VYTKVRARAPLLLCQYNRVCTTSIFVTFVVFIGERKYCKKSQGLYILIRFFGNINSPSYMILFFLTRTRNQIQDLYHLIRFFGNINSPSYMLLFFTKGFSVTSFFFACVSSHVCLRACVIKLQRLRVCKFTNFSLSSSIGLYSSVWFWINAIISFRSE
jgi:hypothetical protein